MPDLRVIGSALEVKGALTSNGVAVPTVSSADQLTNKSFAVQVITVTGATGTDAAAVTIGTPGILELSGGTGASGVNLPVPTVGQVYFVKNAGTGSVKVYCVGGSINGTTGTTALTVTTTGTKGAPFCCSTAGAWQTIPNPT